MKNEKLRSFPILRIGKRKDKRRGNGFLASLGMTGRGWTFLFLLPSLLGVLLFFVLPFGMVIYYSLVNRPVGGEFVGLENFKALLDNRAFLLGAKNTGILLAVSVPLAVLLPLKLALWLERAIPMKSQLRTAFLSPMLVPIASVILV